MNIYTNAIYNYDTETGRLLNVDHYDIDGPNGVGDFSNVTEFVRFGDSTIIYDRVLKNLIITNEDKQIVYKKSFGMTTTDSPYGMWGDWIVQSDEGYDLSGSAVSMSFQTVSTSSDSLDFRLNVHSDSLYKSYLPLPSEYIGQKWLTEMLRYYRSFNPDKEEFIYSWPITDSVFVKGKNGIIKSYLLSTENIAKPPPLPNDPERVLMDPSNKARFLFENGYYSYSYYDPFRKLVLRFAFSGIKEGRVNMNALFDNPDDFDMTMIISNDNYEKLAEFSADEYYPNVVFFKKDGIYLLKRSDNEDEITFERFSIGPSI